MGFVHRSIYEPLIELAKPKSLHLEIHICDEVCEFLMPFIVDIIFGQTTWSNNKKRFV